MELSLGKINKITNNKITDHFNSIKNSRNNTNKYIKDRSKQKVVYDDPFYKFPDPMLSNISHPLSPGYSPLNTNNNNLLSSDPDVNIIRDNGFDYYKNKQIYFDPFHVHKDKIREVIGKGGAVIREISETTGAKIEIDDEGLVSVAAVDAKSGSDAIEWIKGIVEEPEIGKIYEGKVVKLMDFGAFVNFMGSKDGLVHISQLKNERVEKVSDVINEGDVVKVKVLDVDGRGKVKLSMKEVEAE